MRTVAIRGNEYKLAYNLRGLFIYEELAGEPYKGTRTMETYLLMYAMLRANNKDFALEFGELIDACDEDMNIYQTFAEVMKDEEKRVSAFLENKKKAMTQ